MAQRVRRADETMNQDNLRDIMAYMKYKENILQNDKLTLKARLSELKHLLRWAGEIQFNDVAGLEPSFPVFLSSDRVDHRAQPFTPVYLYGVCKEARRFFTWAVVEWPDRYMNIKSSWIQSLRPRKADGLQSVLARRQYWEYEDILKIAALKLDRLSDRRDQAAACFLYLSGMRITAFLTLPIACVHLDRRQVEQLPSQGVKTKFHKAAVTSLLPIPKLLEVVQAWDQLIRADLPDHLPWYAGFRVGGGLRFGDVAGSPEARRMTISKGIRRLAGLADVPYLSPHKLRHGHAMYGIKRAKTMEQLKALSQNLMHSSIQITDGIYGTLVQEDIRKGIASLAVGESRVEAVLVEWTDLFKALAILQSRPDLVQELIIG